MTRIILFKVNEIVLQKDKWFCKGHCRFPQLRVQQVYAPPSSHTHSSFTLFPMWQPASTVTSIISHICLFLLIHTPSCSIKCDYITLFMCTIIQTVTVKWDVFFLASCNHIELTLFKYIWNFSYDNSIILKKMRHSYFLFCLCLLQWPRKSKLCTVHSKQLYISLYFTANVSMAHASQEAMGFVVSPRLEWRLSMSCKQPLRWHHSWTLQAAKGHPLKP